MRAEGRQAALEADTRLAEIELRRRGLQGTDGGLGPLANEIAEPGVEAPEPMDTPDDEPESDRPRAPAGGRGARSFERSARDPLPSRGPAATEEIDDRPEARARRSRLERDRGGRGSSSPPTERRPPAPEPDLLPTSRLRGPVTAPRSADERGGPAARTAFSKPGSTGAGGASSPRRGADSGAKGGDAAGEKGGAHAAAKGGAAAGRPSIDRARLEARLGAGAVIKTTERFRQFQPVAQSHIKVCDWLAQAKTLDEIEALAAGQVSDVEILSVLVLFFERSFLVLEQS
jgi:hypothetical protein